MFSLPFFRSNKNQIKPVVLVVLDGFGLAPPSEGNAISLAKTPYIDRLFKEFPHSNLIASGESVGLPANEVGNTEVGHLTMGSGRVILQDLKRINVAIEKGYYYDNKALLKAAGHVKRNNSKMHLMGLVGSGNVHSSIEHLYTTLQFCKKEDLKNVYLHLFTDGRDSPPKQGLEIIQQIEERLKLTNVGKIASISGRYYAMDRDRRWNRTEKAYKAMVLGHAIQTFSGVDAVKSAYARGQTDEFIEPTIIADKNGPIATVGDSDACFFFNFRIDRAKQLTMAFVLKEFENLKVFDFGYDPDTNIKLGEIPMNQTFAREKVLNNLFFVTMTEYHKNLPVTDIAFRPEVVDKSLGFVLSEAGLKQAHLTESEKERFIKFYFNGMHEEPFPGEEDTIIPSPKVKTYDLKPEMSLPGLVNAIIKQIKKDKFHFIVTNFPNPDMVGHTGNLSAAIKAVEYVDKQLERLVNEVLTRNGAVFITADHGNCEEMLSFPSSTYFITSKEGVVNTDHSNNPVPLIFVSHKSEAKMEPKGSLSDVAPTILGYMGMEVPTVMTGRNLIE